MRITIRRINPNALIRPIRCDELNLNSLDPWDDDPNPRFDYESSQRWIGRFDDDSDWPSATVRRICTTAGHANTPATLICPDETQPPP